MNSIYSYSLEELTKIMLAMGQSAYTTHPFISFTLL